MIGTSGTVVDSEIDNVRSVVKSIIHIITFRSVHDSESIIASHIGAAFHFDLSERPANYVAGITGKEFCSRR